MFGVPCVLFVDHWCLPFVLGCTLVAARCLLFVGCCLLPGALCFLRVAWCVLFVACWLLFVVHCSLFVMCCGMNAARRLSFCVRCLRFDGRRLVSVVCGLLYGVCYMSFWVVVRCALFVVRGLMLVVC